MTRSQSTRIILPALRGVMGRWVYYSCLMPVGELSARVRYADEVHTNARLSEMIQRSLDDDRTQEIADYITTQPERFFNSLVVAVYDGEPNWHALMNVRNRRSDPLLKDLQPEIMESVGFLTLRGDEELFALDGQHRLSGIKQVVDEGNAPAIEDQVAVILVAHQKTPDGLVRTRRLFTTLNKTARKVSTGDTIALDEDDVMAICVRHLIEQTDLFGGTRIAVVAANNIPSGNIDCLTTIGNLYDILAVLFTQSRFRLKASRKALESRRPAPPDLNDYIKYAHEYFNLLREHFPELDEFFSAEKTSDVVPKHRGDHGGSALYRPIGLEVFAQIVARNTNDLDMEHAVKQAAKLPRELTSPPYNGVMWDQGRKRIITGNKATLREILCYMIGTNGTRYPVDQLLDSYRKATGDARATLPDPVF